MDFSNPAGSAGFAASEYTANLLRLLGSRDPLQVLEDLSRCLEPVLSEMAPADLRRREAPGKWSVAEVLAHLADSEMVYGYRCRMILAHDRPDIAGYDQDLWATRLHYNDSDPAESVETLRLLRRVNLRLIRSLSDEELDREGLHSERGPESVRRILALLAGHDLVHRNQIERIRKSLG